MSRATRTPSGQTNRDGAETIYSFDTSRLKIIVSSRRYIQRLSWAGVPSRASRSRQVTETYLSNHHLQSQWNLPMKTQWI